MLAPRRTACLSIRNPHHNAPPEQDKKASARANLADPFSTALLKLRQHLLELGPGVILWLVFVTIHETNGGILRGTLC